MTIEAPPPRSPAPAATRVCRNHPETAAAAYCQQCGIPICADCIQRSFVRQGPFCAPCAERIEAAWTAAHREGTPATVEGARCASHPDRAALRTCDRCGNFLCAACAIPSPWDDRSYCKECLARLEAEGGGGQIPWEDRRTPVFSRYWSTVSQVLFSASTFFQRMPVRGYVPAITFQYHTMLYLVPLTLVETLVALPRGVGRPGMGELVGAMVLVLVLIGAIAPILQFISSGWLHLHLLLFGARRGFEATYRLSSYLGAVAFPWTVLQFLALATRSRLLSLVFLVLLGVYFLVVTTIATTRAHRMNGGLAVLAVLLVAGEAILLWRFVLLPMALRGAGAGMLL